jgi:hypothetical protein
MIQKCRECGHLTAWHEDFGPCSATDCACGSDELASQRQSEAEAARERDGAIEKAAWDQRHAQFEEIQRLEALKPKPASFNHEDQVRAFISALAGFTPADWTLVAAKEAMARAAFGDMDLLQFQQMMGAARLNHLSTLLIRVAQIFRYQLEISPRFPLSTINRAIWALAGSDKCTWGWFAASYAPFAALIPLESLGKFELLDGISAEAPSPGTTMVGRFGTRLRALDSPEWGTVLNLVAARSAALGTDAISAAHRETAARALKVVGSPTFRYAGELMSAIGFAKGSPSLASDGERGVWSMIAKRLQQPQLESLRVEPLAHEDLAAAAAAEDAVFALLVDPGLSERATATLYLPFEAVIPAHSLLP